MIYLITGVFTIFIGPLVGKLADKHGKYPVFLGGSILSIVMVLIYTRLPPVSLTVVDTVNVVLFAGLFSRIIPFQAMSTSVPEMTKHGSFDRRPYRHDGADGSLNTPSEDEAGNRPATTRQATV